MADLITVWTFFENEDAHAEFLHRVAAAVTETALDYREQPDPSPVTPLWVALESWALAALLDPLDKARDLLPALAVKANEAGLISEEGEISATDGQIRATVANLVPAIAYCLPELP